VNAPAIWQRVITETLDTQPDLSLYQRRRDFMHEALTRVGYQVPKPEGTFYMFPKTPIPDDFAFVRMLIEEGVLAVPGSGFGRPGYMRLSLTIPMEAIERSLAGFERAFHRARTGA
jgi:aspartate aminotransferase